MESCPTPNKHPIALLTCRLCFGSLTVSRGVVLWTAKTGGEPSKGHRDLVAEPRERRRSQRRHHPDAWSGPRGGETMHIVKATRRPRATFLGSTERTEDRLCSKHISKTAAVHVVARFVFQQIASPIICFVFPRVPPLELGYCEESGGHLPRHGKFHGATNASAENIRNNEKCNNILALGFDPCFTAAVKPYFGVATVAGLCPETGRRSVPDRLEGASPEHGPAHRSSRLETFDAWAGIWGRAPDAAEGEIIDFAITLCARIAASSSLLPRLDVCREETCCPDPAYANVDPQTFTLGSAWDYPPVLNNRSSRRSASMWWSSTWRRCKSSVTSSRP